MRGIYDGNHIVLKVGGCRQAKWGGQPLSGSLSRYPTCKCTVLLYYYPQLPTPTSLSPTL
ncbi:hypothetical protein FIBSPDRAFT_846464 [Athelia psychrophila]|uniref:Uncharacterized protein n=1 Tax=Athelia psychrophila TaxID=1759441 RepID=A0A167UM13_9AGAM|nr:hypothetical protein FIBSPDRAFT_878884 [Fibularhizoctonia sp. CBS 109695]KZP34358.1 hypothetical protein FIBSPDRAFT_846464 [Fibularhizoctonia sp. CBS 109695]